MMTKFQYQFQDVDLATNGLTQFSGCLVSYIDMISSDGKKNQVTLYFKCLWADRATQQQLFNLPTLSAWLTLSFMAVLLTYISADDFSSELHINVNCKLLFCFSSQVNINKIESSKPRQKQILSSNSLIAFIFSSVW